MWKASPQVNVARGIRKDEEFNGLNLSLNDDLSSAASSGVYLIFLLAPRNT